MTNDTPGASNSVLFAAVFNQNWENVRHVKNERISFMNAYSLISAGVLTLLQNMHTSDLIRTALLLFMTLFSAFGFLTSLRLKAELEECLDKIGVMTTAAKLRVRSARAARKQPMALSKVPMAFPGLLCHDDRRIYHPRPLPVFCGTAAVLTNHATATPWIYPSYEFVLRPTNLVRERALGFISSNHPG